MSTPFPICPYCNTQARLFNGLSVYPHRPDLKMLRFWMCKPCDAYVGCHKKGAWVETAQGRVTSDGTLPLGRLANAELRKAKKDAHDALDMWWQCEDNKPKARCAVYKRLADALGISVYDCHIGMFDVDRCDEVLRICDQWAEKELRA